MWAFMSLLLKHCSSLQSLRWILQIVMGSETSLAKNIYCRRASSLSLRWLVFFLLSMFLFYLLELDFHLQTISFSMSLTICQPLTSNDIFKLTNVKMVTCFSKSSFFFLHHLCDMHGWFISVQPSIFYFYFVSFAMMMK